MRNAPYFSPFATAFLPDGLGDGNNPVIPPTAPLAPSVPDASATALAALDARITALENRPVPAAPDLSAFATKSDLAGLAKEADLEIIADHISIEPTAPKRPDDATWAQMSGVERENFNQSMRDYQETRRKWLDSNLTADDIAYLRKTVLANIA